MAAAALAVLLLASTCPGVTASLRSSCYESRTRALVNRACPFLFGAACRSCVRHHGNHSRLPALCSADAASNDTADASLNAALQTVCLSRVPVTLTPIPPTHLSEARRNIGGVAMENSGVAVFAGGCTLKGLNSQFICNEASSAIDTLDGNGTLVHTARLSEARGWASACAVGDHAVFAGGGMLISAHLQPLQWQTSALLWGRSRRVQSVPSCSCTTG